MRAICLVCLLWPAIAIPLAQQKSFGHSIKNGNLPAGSEVTTFEHNCSIPPCVVTQVSVPSIYPKGGDPWNWTDGVVSFYVDGEKSPSIAMTLLELAGEAHFNLAGTSQQGGDSMPDGSPWGIALMGRTAKSGSVYSTVRVPFGKSIRATIRPPPSSQHESTFWFILRGLEGHPVVLGDLELPAAARLRLHRLPPAPVEKLQFLTLAEAPAGTSGALLRVHFDAKGQDFGYLEACMRFFPDGAPDTEPLFLSSGAEDYFLGASYFDEGMFKTPNSGLTYFNRSISAVGAYKTHTSDPVVWRDGMRLIFRACETTSGCGDMEHCPDRFCNAEQRSTSRQESVTRDTPAYDEYFLGAQGETCTSACEGRGLHCSADMNLGDADHGAGMMARLGVGDCLKNATQAGKEMGLQWWAADQPNYVSGERHGDTLEENYKHCVGWVGYPAKASCDAFFATVERVCHCVSTPPSPPASGIEYSTLVWTYEWPSAALREPLPSDATGPALRLVQQLVGRGLLTEPEEDAVTDMLVAADTGAVRLLGAFADIDVDGQVASRVARQVKRYIAASGLLSSYV